MEGRRGTRTAYNIHMHICTYGCFSFVLAQLGLRLASLYQAPYGAPYGALHVAPHGSPYGASHGVGLKT